MFNFNFESNKFIGSGYLRCTLPEEVKREVQNTIEKIDRGDIKTSDKRKALAGHLQKETTYPVTEKLNYLVTSLCAEYDNVFRTDFNARSHIHPNFVKEFTENGYTFEYVLRDLWINYGKKYDFNPPHNHTGLYSFVLWVKIPYKFEDEEKVYPHVKKSHPGIFEFFFPKANTLGGIGNQTVDAVDWDLIIFPSSLAHTVYPFYTSDEERISIAGNLYFEPVKKGNK